MNLADVMDGLADVLATLPGLRVFAYPPDDVAPPAGIVGYPTLLTYDAVMGGGANRADVPVHVVVGRASSRAARDALTEYVATSGAKSFHAALEDDPTLGDRAQAARVVSVAGVSLTIGGVSYVAAEFTVDVIA